VVSEELNKLEINPIATIPVDEELNKHDMKLKPLLDLPDTSKAVMAVNDLLDRLLNKEGK
jgi:CO dehydrogenase nickel-insertion accessory protein CooC1